jgi:hypothetical protein
MHCSENTTCCGKKVPFFHQASEACLPGRLAVPTVQYMPSACRCRFPHERGISGILGKLKGNRLQTSAAETY